MGVPLTCIADDGGVDKRRFVNAPVARIVSAGGIGQRGRYASAFETCSMSDDCCADGIHFSHETHCGSIVTALLAVRAAIGRQGRGWQDSRLKQG